MTQIIDAWVEKCLYRITEIFYETSWNLVSLAYQIHSNIYHSLRSGWHKLKVYATKRSIRLYFTIIL